MPDRNHITRAELAGALIRLGHAGTLNVDRLFSEALAQREPEWQGGEVVRDANDVFWRRSRATDTWYRFGYREDHEHSRPKRPLTLVGRERA